MVKFEMHLFSTPWPWEGGPEGSYQLSLASRPLCSTERSSAWPQAGGACGVMEGGCLCCLGAGQAPGGAEGEGGLLRAAFCGSQAFGTNTQDAAKPSAPRERLSVTV